MLCDIEHLPRSGVDGLDGSLKVAVREAEEFVSVANSESDDQQIIRQADRFVDVARGHLNRELEVLESCRRLPHWWRYTYLRRLLDEIETAAHDHHGAPAIVRLMEMWAFEQVSNAPRDVARRALSSQAV